MSKLPSTAALPLNYADLHGIDGFPGDLIFDILLLLPIKSLLRFRRVSKSWRALIDSTHFVKKHLQRNIECNPDSGIIVKHPNDQRGIDMYLAEVDPLHDMTATGIADESLRTCVSGADFVDSCNGLVCLYKNKDILLWNPATRKCRKLPKPTNMPLQAFPSDPCVIGFGYDHVNDDYKVMITANRQIWGIMVNVYSLKGNSWRRADTMANDIELQGPFGVHLNGTLYWLTKNIDDIVAFDLGVGIHRKIPYPVVVEETKKNCICLFVINKRLCLIALYNDHTDVWMMDDNGLENSWSKLLSVEYSGILGPCEFLYPLAFSKTRNEFLIVVDGVELKWYNPESDEVRDVTIHGFPSTFYSVVYTESLVPLSYDLKLDSEQLLKSGGKRKRQEQQQKKMIKESLPRIEKKQRRRMS